MRVDLVIAHYNETLNWMSEIDTRKYRPVLVSKTIRDADIYQDKNIGYEASAYLEYIVKHYNELPEFVVFVHGHETAWHQIGRIQDILNSFTFDETTPDFYNFNNNHINIFKKGNIVINEASTRELLEHIPMIDAIGFDMDSALDFNSSSCAQFIVHKSLIQRHSQETYKKLLEQLYSWRGTRSNAEKLVAIVYEWIWTFIFTGWYNELEYIEKYVKSYNLYVAGHHCKI